MKELHYIVNYTTQLIAKILCDVFMICPKQQMQKQMIYVEKSSFKNLRKK